MFRFLKHTLKIFTLSNSMEGARVHAFFAVGVMQQITCLFVGAAIILKHFGLVKVHLVLVALSFQRQLKSQIHIKLKNKAKSRETDIQSRLSV